MLKEAVILSGGKNVSRKNELGLLLKDLLKKHSLSMRKLSQMTNIDTATISRIVNGKRKATLEHLEKFSEHLHVSMNQLLIAAGYTESLKNEHNIYVEQIQRLLESSHADDFSIEQIDQKLAEYREYAQTEDGKMMILSEFEDKLKKVDSVGPFITHLKKFYERFRLRRGSHYELILIGSVLLYFIIPVDVIPDYVFPIGYLDDAIAVQLVTKLFVKD